MTARQRGPPVSATRSTGGLYNYPRQGTGDDREGQYNDTYNDRGYVNPRGRGIRNGHLEVIDNSVAHQNGYRPRTDSNVSLPVESNRIPRLQHPEESRGRGASMNTSPNRMYRDDNRPRSGHSNNASTRDKPYFTPGDYQPPQFPQNPHGGQRQSSIVDKNQDGGTRRSRPNSRTQSPNPPYPSTPSQQHRYDGLTPDQSRPRGNFTQQIQTEQEQNYSYQLAPLKFSTPRAQESYKLLAGTQFDDITNSPDSEHFKHSPPASMRPPPPPPPRHNKSSTQANVDHSRTSIYLQGTLSTADAETPPRSASNRDSADEEWPLEQVIEFLRVNGFGEPWQQAFRAADIHGEKFRACSSFPDAKKLVNIQEAHQPIHGKTLFKLITLIRKVLNPDSDTPDSETSLPTPRRADRPRRVSDNEGPPLRSLTAPVTGARPLASNINLPSPDSPDTPLLPNSAKLFPRHNSEQFGHAYVGGGIDRPTPKLKAPPPPRARSPQSNKRPMSPTVGDARQPPQNQFLVQYNNRHSKNFSTDSNQSERSANHPVRSSQDFQEILRTVGKDGSIVPQKRVDKKKSHEQMSKGGIFSRFFPSRAKDVVVEVVHTPKSE